MGELTGLIERLEKATGPDRELDLALAQTLVPDVIVGRQRDDDSGYDPYTYWRYTEKIDAALALVERLLPGWSIKIVINGDDQCVCVLKQSGRMEVAAPAWVNSAPTAPIAILLALLRAFEPQRGQT